MCGFGTLSYIRSIVRLEDLAVSLGENSQIRLDKRFITVRTSSSCARKEGRGEGGGAHAGKTADTYDSFLAASPRVFPIFDEKACDK